MIRHVRLELARCHDFPEGSPEHGYELTLPLTPDGHLDRDEWLTHRERTGVHRFWNGDEVRGRLAHGHSGWKFVFNDGPDSEEALFKGDRHRFAEGEYVTLTEHDGEMRTFRVARVH